MPTAEGEAKTVMAVIFEELEKRGIPWAKNLHTMSSKQWKSFEKLHDRLCKFDQVIVKLNSLNYGLEELKKTQELLKDVDPKIITQVFHSLSKLDDDFNDMR